MGSVCEPERSEPYETIQLEFGPTIVATLNAVGNPVPSPDFTKIFITRAAFEGTPFQTDVGMLEVLIGLEAEDTRLRDAIMQMAQPTT